MGVVEAGGAETARRLMDVVDSCLLMLMVGRGRERPSGRGAGGRAWAEVVRQREVCRMVCVVIVAAVAWCALSVKRQMGVVVQALVHRAKAASVDDLLASDAVKDVRMKVAVLPQC